MSVAGAEHELSLPRERGDTRWITRTVALLAIVVFTVSGAQILPAIFAANGHSQVLPRGEITAFLLNVALILFAWRRSAQLMQTAAQRDAAQDLAHRLAYYDDLTGLFNRRRFNELLSELCSNGGGKSALLLIDLDHFKRVNDLHGHAAGDQLLTVTADRIAENCPPEAQCFRLGGDEFAIILSGNSAREKDALRIAETVLESLVKPAAIANTTVATAGSIGIAIITKKCRHPAIVLERADVAMYEAKRLGRNRCFVFDDAMETELERRRQFEREMREGIESGQFVPFFQPIFDLASGEVIGFEVLARWNHPSRGLLEPPNFMETAERTGLISDLSFLVMYEALTVVRAWPSHLKISVNVSPVQFNDPLIAHRILKVLSLTGFPAQRLEIEIMERCLLENLNSALSVIASLKNSGISVAVDDFGIGYGSLAELKSLPFDRIKIDRTFIASLLDDDRCDALVEAIATLGKGLRLPITAEGVEAESLRSRLLDLGCTDAQGWVFAQALSAGEVVLGFGRTWDQAVSDEQQAPVADPSERMAAGG